jgi:hypothetical protein
VIYFLRELWHLLSWKGNRFIVEICLIIAERYVKKGSCGRMKRVGLMERMSEIEAELEFINDGQLTLF